MHAVDIGTGLLLSGGASTAQEKASTAKFSVQQQTDQSVSALLICTQQHEQRNKVSERATACL